MAGLFITFDGLSFVMSRLALLDIFQAVFAVAAVSALVADRDWFRHRLANYLRKRDLPDLGGGFGPLMLWRPWRIVAGLMFGASCAVKWNSVFMIATFGVLVVFWDLGARRLAGAGRASWLSPFIDAPFAFIQLVVVAVPVYIGSWFRWLQTDGGYYRQWGVENPDDPIVQRFGSALGALWHYHVAAYEFHTGDGMMVDATHPYEAHPAGWLFMLRPIGIEAVNDIQPGQEGCHAVGTTCLRIISAAGTPLLWWFAVVAIALAIMWWIMGRDWRFSVPLLGIASTYLPWFRYAGRPLFFFYAIMIIPFSATLLAMALETVGASQPSPTTAAGHGRGHRRRADPAELRLHPPHPDRRPADQAGWLMRMWLGNAWI